MLPASEEGPHLMLSFQDAQESTAMILEMVSGITLLSPKYSFPARTVFTYRVVNYTTHKCIFHSKPLKTVLLVFF